MKWKRTGARAVLPVVALAVLTSLAGAGCGGGEDTQAALTQAQYRERANLICNAASQEQFMLGGKYIAAHPNADQADAVEPALLPPLEQQLRKLQALPVPDGYEKQIESFLGALEEGVDAGKADPQSLLATRNNPFDKANALGKRYQLGDCSGNP
jgi:hypothetical protein